MGKTKAKDGGDGRSEPPGESTEPSARADEVTIEMANRDPHGLNDHVQTRFEDTIGEPEGAHSEDWVWVNSYKAYKVGANCCYTCLTYVCAIPLAFCWGCYFSCLTFCHIWSCTPWFRAFKINFTSFARFFSAVIHCCCDPFYEAVALMFTQIFVNIRHNAQEFQERTYTGLQHFSIPVESKSSPILMSKKRNSPDVHHYDNKGAEEDTYDDI